jgi:hypothetical protein
VVKAGQGVYLDKEKSGRKGKECGSLLAVVKGIRKGMRGRLYSAKEGVRLHASPLRPRWRVQLHAGEVNCNNSPCNVIYCAACAPPPSARLGCHDTLLRDPLVAVTLGHVNGDMFGLLPVSTVVFSL